MAKREPDPSSDLVRVLIADAHARARARLRKPLDEDVLDAPRAGAVGYLPKDTDPARLPHVLQDTLDGGAPIPRHLVTRLVAEFRDHGPRRRSVLNDNGHDLTSREWEVLDLLRQG